MTEHNIDAIRSVLLDGFKQLKPEACMDDVSIRIEALPEEEAQALSATDQKRYSRQMTVTRFGRLETVRSIRGLVTNFSHEIVIRFENINAKELVVIAGALIKETGVRVNLDPEWYGTLIFRGKLEDLARIDSTGLITSVNLQSGAYEARGGDARTFH